MTSKVGPWGSGRQSTFEKTPLSTVDARPYKAPDVEEFHISNMGYYCRSFVWVRDLGVGLFNFVGACLLFSGTVFLLLEAHTLKKDIVKIDGDYGEGLRGWTLMYIGFLMMAISDLQSIILTLVSRVNVNVSIWWPEGEYKDLLRQLVSLGANVAASIFSLDIINIMTPDYADILDTTSLQEAAAKRTIQWQLFYGVRRHHDTALDGTPMGTMFSFDEALLGLLVVYIVRTAYILVAWFVTHEKPFYLFPCCLSRIACSTLHPNLGGEDHSQSYDDETGHEYVRCDPLACGGFFSRYVHNQLGSVRNHVHVSSIFFMAGMALLFRHGEGGNEYHRGFVVWNDDSARGSFSAESDPLCMYVNLTMGRGPDAWENLGKWSCSAPGTLGDQCINPSLYVVQDPIYFTGTADCDGGRCTMDPTTSSPTSNEICTQMNGDATACDADAGCAWSPCETVSTKAHGRLEKYAGLRLNQMECASTQLTVAQGGIADNNFNFRPSTAAGVPLLKKPWAQEDSRTRLNAFDCCPGASATSNLAQDNDTGHAMWLSAWLFVIGATTHLLSVSAQSFAMIAFGISATPSDVPRNTAMCQLMPC